jgi:hypothetical protein
MLGFIPFIKHEHYYEPTNNKNRMAPEVDFVFL